MHSAEMLALIDALVEAVDTDRAEAVDRLRDALTPYGVATLFVSELRFYGRSSEAGWSVWGDLEVEVEY